MSKCRLGDTVSNWQGWDGNPAFPGSKATPVGQVVFLGKMKEHLAPARSLHSPALSQLVARLVAEDPLVPRRERHRAVGASLQDSDRCLSWARPPLHPSCWSGGAGR